jgi:CheY-like chemotaxis protein
MEDKRPANCTVMVVDDEPDMRHLLRITLELAGYGVVEAAHGEAALEQVRRSPPQIVLTDWMMPRMNGGELIERAAGRREHEGDPNRDDQRHARCPGRGRRGAGETVRPQ